MKKFNQLKSVLTYEFSILNKESLMLVLGGQAHTVAAQGSCGSCGSSGSSQSCDNTAVCNCMCPIIKTQPKPSLPSTNL